MSSSERTSLDLGLLAIDLLAAGLVGFPEHLLILQCFRIRDLAGRANKVDEMCFLSNLVPLTLRTIFFRRQAATALRFRLRGKKQNHHFFFVSSNSVPQVHLVHVVHTSHAHIVLSHISGLSMNM